MLPSFTDTFEQFVYRSGYSMGQLSRLTGVPKRTIANWIEGRVKRPRDYTDLLKLAAAMHLPEADASLLLQSANHPPIAELLTQPTNSKQQALLQPWANQLLQAAPFQVIPDLPYFVGRDNALAELTDVLLNGRIAMICSVQGMGGVGKTTLAVHLAYQLRSQFPDGVLWARVDTSDPMAILHSFAQAYQVDVSRYRDLDSRSRMVRNLLADKRALMILDNAESSAQVAPLLPPTGLCRVIITTRHHNLIVTSGSHRLHLHPFDASKETALTLFAKILGEARTNADRQPLLEIANLLGHLPLAINIIASRLAYEPGWSTLRMLSRLQQTQRRLRELTYDTQSVRISITVSHQALSTDEQHFFASLSVFSGTHFDVEAAAYINNISLENAHDQLRKLYSLSLVNAERTGRYYLHPLLYDYAREQLKQLEEEQVLAYSQRFVNYFKHYVTTHERDYAALALEMDNVLGALDTAVTHKLHAHMIEIINHFAYYLQARGLHDKAKGYLQQAMEMAYYLEDQVELAIIFFHLGEIHRELGQFSEAEAQLRQGLALARSANHPQKICQLLGSLGITISFLGQCDALNYMVKSLTLAYELNDQWQIVIMRNALGVTALYNIQYEEAYEHLTEGLAIARTANFEDRIAGFLSNLGVLAKREDKSEEAKRYLTEALELAQQLGHQELIAITHINLGECALSDKNYELATQHHHVALSLAKGMSNHRLMSHILVGLGEIANHQGILAQVDAYYEQSEQLMQQIGTIGYWADILERWGDLYLSQTRWQQAERPFTGMLRVAEASSQTQQYEGRGLYGLARVAQGYGKMTLALERGQTAQQLLEEANPPKATEVADWLATVVVPS